MPGSSGFRKCFFMDCNLDIKLPPSNQRVCSDVLLPVNRPKGIALLPFHDKLQYKLQLDLFIQDKQVEKKKERENITELSRELHRLVPFYSKHPGVDYSRTVRTNCHPQEGNNRSNCPYKSRPLRQNSVVI